MDTLEPLVQNLTPTELLDIYTPNAEVWIRATRYHSRRRQSLAKFHK